jgi:O-antigen/teichoic acid export membrane protein
MSIKKNFGYNSILLLSQYIIPLIIFPYISRVFGVEKIGLLNYADSIVNYFILFSTMGLTLTGIREVAKNKNNRAKLNKVFSELLLLHIISTIVMLCAYVGFIYFVDKFTAHKDLYLVGASKLVFNVFLLEWFFRGTENHKFIALRSVFIKILYVVLIFIFIKTKEDYVFYFVLTCGAVVVNGLINWWYSKRHVTITFFNLNIRKHLKSFFNIGFYLMLTSMYTTFNVIYLGTVSNSVSVGNYTTSLKLYTIILGIFSALSTVLVPRLSSLLVDGDQISFNSTIQKSISFVTIITFPIIMYSIALAPQIISLTAGSGFEGVILCFRIIMPLIFIVGIAQVLSHQILLSLKIDRMVLIASVFGAIIGFSLNLLLVPIYSEIGTSVVVVISEVSVTAILYYFCVKNTSIRLPLNHFFLNFTVSIPYLLICFVCVTYLKLNVLVLFVSFIVSFIYFLLSQLHIVKNPIFLSEYGKIMNILKRFVERNN